MAHGTELQKPCPGRHWPPKVMESFHPTCVCTPCGSCSARAATGFNQSGTPQALRKLSVGCPPTEAVQVARGQGNWAVIFNAVQECSAGSQVPEALSTISTHLEMRVQKMPVHEECLCRRRRRCIFGRLPRCRSQLHPFRMLLLLWRSPCSMI